MKKIMNFFKNHTQKERLQSLKKEQVVEMVKNNKVPILLISFALFVMIAFGILISGMGRQEKEQENLFLEEQAQLWDMTTYLDEIENVVSTNTNEWIFCTSSGTVYAPEKVLGQKINSV